jgi:hypothetical protein
LSRFDKIVLTFLLVLALLTTLIIGLGDRVGVQVVSVSPADGTTDVSTRTVLQITFDQLIAPVGSGFPISMSPPVSGTLRWNDKTVTFVPAKSLVANTTYTVTLAADLQSQQGRPLTKSLTWQFQTRQPRVLYVAPDAQLKDQLFVLTPGSQPTQLTQEQFGIWDFAVAPDGAVIVYAALREDGGSDLWEIAPDGTGARQLLACPETVCNGESWSPDGSRFVYERRNIFSPGAAPGPPHLWWLDLASGETVPVFEDKQWVGYGARWSPDSRWLSYISPNNQGVQVYW